MLSPLGVNAGGDNLTVDNTSLEQKYLGLSASFHSYRVASSMSCSAQFCLRLVQGNLETVLRGWKISRAIGVLVGILRTDHALQYQMAWDLIKAQHAVQEHGMDSPADYARMREKWDAYSD